jgi:hypothetical protein
MTDNSIHSHNTEVGGIGLVTVILALVFLFVWPGPLRYEYRVNKEVGVLRIDRLNGHASTLLNGRYAEVSDMMQGRPIKVGQ